MPRTYDDWKTTDPDGFEPAQKPERDPDEWRDQKRDQKIEDAIARSKLLPRR